MRPERKLIGLLTDVLLKFSDSCENHLYELAVTHQQEPHSNSYRLREVNGQLKPTYFFSEDLGAALDQWNNLSVKLIKGNRQALAKLLEVTAEITKKVADSAVFVLRPKGKHKGIPIAPSHLTVSDNGQLEPVLPSRLDRSIISRIDEINLLTPDLRRRSFKPRIGGSSEFANYVIGLKNHGLVYDEIAKQLHKSGRFNEYAWLGKHNCNRWLDALKPANKRSFQKFLGHF